MKDQWRQVASRRPGGVQAASSVLGWNLEKFAGHIFGANYQQIISVPSPPAKNKSRTGITTRMEGELPALSYYIWRSMSKPRIMASIDLRRSDTAPPSLCLCLMYVVCMLSVTFLLPWLHILIFQPKIKIMTQNFQD